MNKNYVLLILLIGASQIFGISPKHPNSNIAWPSSSNGTFSVVVIQNTYNSARRAEENQFGSIPANAMGNLVLPSQADWDGMTYSERGLFLVNAERTCRAGLNYGQGVVMGLPLEGVELHIQDLAEYYANYLMDNQAFSHSADGYQPWDRIDNHCIIGTANNVVPTLDCHEFNTRSENLAVLQHAIPGANGDVIAKSIYLWIYSDAPSAWGHRAACLIQDSDPENGGGGFSNNRGSAANEGFIGFGVIHGSFQGAPESDMIVMEIVDPAAVADCDYQVIGTNNSYVAPMTILETTGDFSANRSRIEKINGEDWTHYLDDNGTPTNDSDDILLFSIKLDNQYIGTLCDGAFEVKLGVDMANTTARITSATAPYIGGNGFDVLSRYWEVEPIKQPLVDVEIMYYYTNTELDDILLVCDGAMTAADLTWFKFESAANIDPNPQNGHAGAVDNDVVDLAPSFGAFGSNLYAAIVVGSFSGGGGGTSQGDDGTPIDPPPLAVDLLYFEGKEELKGNHLKWATSREYNSSLFVVEKSTDGKTFEYLETLESNETSFITNFYDYIDKNVTASVNYYRLSEEDIDGTITDLGTIVINNKNVSKKLSIYPNPIVDYLTIETDSDYQANYEIISLSGEIIEMGVWTKGNQLNLTRLSPGNYYIRLIFDNETIVDKILKL